MLVYQEPFGNIDENQCQNAHKKVHRKYVDPIGTRVSNWSGLLIVTEKFLGYRLQETFLVFLN